MGLTTVIRDYGTEILNAIRENDLHKLRMILEKTLRSDAKIAKLCVTDIKHKPTKKFACPLILAARQEDPRIMKYMMEKGTDPNFVHHTIFSSKRREIVTALHLAVDLGHYDTAEVLLNANADANIYDHNKETPLHIAVKKADHTMMKLLLSKGADPLIPDNKNNAALHIATLYGHLQMVRTLLKYDADVYQKGQWETVPPHIAAKEGHTHLIQLFSAKDLAIINVKIPCYLDRREKAPIHLAAENGHAECLSVLLEEFDANVNMKDSDGNTALHCVVLHPYDAHRMRDKEYFTQSARLLLKFRVSINEKNIFGDTALHFAAMNHYHRIVELLLDNGANPFLENEDGMKPIDTVPESDPVTKQILKMAMTKGRPPISISSAQRRAVDGSINNTTLQDSALDQSRSNISYRSVSSTSSVFIDDTKPVRSHRSREVDGRHSRSKSKTKLPEVEETPRAETELTQQQQDVPRKIENEIAVYSKVNKKQRPKQRASQGRAMDLGYDQQEWEVISTTTMNEESVQGSIISQHEPNKTAKESKTSDSRQSQQQQTCVSELADIEKQQEYIEKKNRINKHQKHRSEQDDIGLDIAVPQHEEEVPPARVGKKGEVIYENITPLTAEEAPPLPPRKNRPSTSVDDQQQPGLEQRQCIEDGAKVHKIVGHPSAIEVQYEGGPIMISVETSNDPGEKKHSRASKHKRYSTPSPKQHRKQSASPKIKRKCEHDIPSGHTYDDEQMEEPVSPMQKHADHKELGTSESYTSAQEYYRDYYDEKAIKKKKRSKVAQTAGQTSSDPVGNLEQSMDNYFNGTYDISELESFQQSMMSESSQPELVKKIIEQKICELLEQKARKGKKSQKSDDRLKQWLMETDENDEDTEDTEDEDKEHILDSDEWSDDEEFQTPSKWLETEEGNEDEYYAQEVEQKRMPTKSTPLKQQPVAGHRKPKTQQKEVVTVEKDQSRLKEYKPEIVETPPKSVKQSPVKSLHKINIVKESSEVIMPNEQREHDEEGNEVSVKSPGQMTFKEKLAWAKAQEKKQAELGTTVKNLEAETHNMTSLLTKATTAAGEQGRQKSKVASEGSDQSVKEQEHHNEYYSLAHDIECSTSSTSTDVSTTVTTDTQKASQFTEKEKSAPEKEQAMEVEEYEGSPFSRRRNAKYIQSHADAEAEDTASVTTRLRSKSQNDILDVDDRERSVSPVTLKDIPKHGLRTSSVVSEGTGLGLRVSGQVPKAYSHAEKSSARRAFMLASPVKIESSSECSDTELHGSRSSVSEGSGHKDRGKLWEESMQKPVYPKHSSGLTSATSTSDTEISKRSSNGTTVKTGTKIIGGYTKPYKSFGKIEVNTDLIEEAMLNASIPEDPETASDLEPFEVSDIEREVDNKPKPHVEVNIEKTKGFHVEELDQEPGFARFARQQGGEEKETSQQVPPLPLNSPPAIKPEEPQLSPRSDTSSVSGRKVVSVKENLRSENGDIIEVITTTVIKQEVPHAEVAVTETVAPTDDLSFGDSTGDDLDELVLQNMQIKTPSELPPPPPELMNTDDSQELNPLTDKTNKINMHDEQIGENEQVQQTKTGNLKKKSKSKKSTENLADASELEPKKKKKKKKKAKPAEQDNKNAQEHIQVEESLKEDTSLEMYDQEPGVIKPKKVKGIPTVLALGKEGIQQKPSEMAELQYTERQVETEQHKSRPDKEMDVAGVQVLQQTDEQGQTSDSVKQKLPTDFNQSMTDMEVAQITDAAEARRKAREAARAQRLWHKKMIEEGKDPSIFLKSRSHSRETSDEQRKASPSPTRNVKPDSYNIVIEGQAELATSEGKRIIVSSENVQQKQDRADDSVLGKQSKKKKTKKLCSTDDLVSEKKKKKKKKKTVSEDEAVLVGTSGGVDELAPKGTVQGVPPETVISDIWKEAMEGQPLASSETVYKEKPLNSSSEVRISRRGRKPKGTTAENIAQHANDVDEDMSEASLQGLIKPATVPLIDNTEQYDSISDDEFEQDSENVLSVELTPAEKEQIIAKKEAKKKQQKLIRLGKKYKLEDGNTVNDEIQKQQQKQQDSELITLDRSPGATRQKQQKSRVQHAVLLQQTEDKSPEGTFEEPLPDKFVHAATVQQVKPAVQSSYETNLDEESPVSYLDEEIPVAAMNLTEEQKRAIMKAREAKKQQQVHEKPVSLEAHAFREGSLPVSDQQHITDQRQQSGHTHGVQLQQKIDDFIPEGDELPQDFIKRAAIPDFGTGQRAAYETNLDDSDEQKNSETGHAITNVQQAELNKTKEVRRLQQSLDKIAKHREKEKSMKPQQKISAQELKINQEISDNSRPKHAVQLRQQQEYPHDDDDDDGSSLSENIIRRVDVPAGSVAQKFEISQEDSDDVVHNQSQTDIITVSLTKEQREAKARAMEEKKQAKARERRERKSKQQNIHSAEEAQPGQPATDRPVNETNLDSPAELVKESLQNVQEKRQELDEEGYLLPQPSREQHRKPHQSHSAVKLKQPYQDEDEYLEISEPMPDYVIQKVQPPSLPPRPSYEAELDDLHPEQTDTSELLITGQKSQDKFKNAAFAAFKKMQGQDQKTKDVQEPEADDISPESGEAFTRSASGRIRVKRAARPNISQQNKEVFIDREPELMGEDALPPDGNTDAQLQQELARLRGAGQSSTPLMSELWQEKKEQESEMKLMLQSVQDPAELEPNKSRLGGLPPPPTEPLPTEVGGEKPAGIRDLDKSGQQQSPSGSMHKPPKAPVKVDRRPPPGLHTSDSPHLSQSGLGESPHSTEGFGRPRSQSEGKQYEPRARTGSEGRSPRHMQPVKRRIRRAYPSDGELYAGHQSDSEATRKSRCVKSISFYGDFRRGAAEKRDKPPKMTASQSLEEAAWKAIRQDLENQPQLRPHRVIKRRSEKTLNYTRGIYRPVPVYWRGSQRSFANTSRYDDSELIDQLWNERHRSMTTESEGDADMEDASYDVNMPEHGTHESDQFGSDQQANLTPYSHSMSDDEHNQLPQYSSAPQLPPSELQHGQYFGAFQPIGPPKKVTIVDKKHRTRHQNERKDLPPRIIDPRPVDFKNYGAAAKLWMEQVDRTQTQKSKTMYLSMMGDQQPPPEIIQDLVEDEQAEASQGSQWVIARGRSLRRAKQYYDQQRQMEGDIDQENLDPGKQMLLFFKIGENWKDLAWVLFDGLQSEGDTLRMLKEIQHRHPDKINDQVHDMMHRWWKKKGSAATIEELQRGLEVLKMAYVEEEYVNSHGVFSETETELDASTASEEDAEVNRLIHDYKTRSLNASFENKTAQNAAVQLKTPESNSALNTDNLLRKLEEAAIEHKPAKINRNSITRASPQPPSKPKHEDSHGESDFEGSADGTHRHSFVIIQPQLDSKEYKHETNM